MEVQDHSWRRRRYNFNLSERASQELTELARDTNTNRSRMVEQLVMMAREVLEASAVIERRRRRPWWERLLRIHRGGLALGPGR